MLVPVPSTRTNWGNRREQDGCWERRCSKCRTWQPEGAENFPVIKRADGVYWDSNCRSCRRKHARERMQERRADPVEAQQVRDERTRHRNSPQGRAWRSQRYVIDNAAHRQRHTGAPCTLTPAQWARICELLGYCCAYCGNQAERKRRPGGTWLEIDHIIPVCAEGFPGTIFGNVIPACCSCNRSKGRRSVEQWRPEILPHLHEVLSRLQTVLFC